MTDLTDILSGYIFCYLVFSIAWDQGVVSMSTSTTSTTKHNLHLNHVLAEPTSGHLLLIDILLARVDRVDRTPFPYSRSNPPAANNITFILRFSPGVSQH